jgi:hypothetical protein
MIETGVSFANKTRIDDVTAIRKTAKALICEIDGMTYAVPDSQIDDESEVWAVGDEGVLVVNEWWAEKEGLA